MEDIHRGCDCRNNRNHRINLQFIFNRRRSNPHRRISGCFGHQHNRIYHSELWHMERFFKTIIIILMFIGACAGSTGGGLKISRIEIMAKTASKTLRSLVRPNSVSNIKIDGKTIDDETVRTTNGYFILYMALFAISVILVSVNSLTLEESISSVATCINNVGPGLGVVGPIGNFSSLSFSRNLC